MWRDRPVHDRASHGASAFMTGATGHGLGVVEALPEATVTPRPWQRMRPGRRW